MGTTERAPEPKPDDALIRRTEHALDRLGCPHLKPYARWRLGYEQDREPSPPLSTTGRGSDNG